MSQPIRKRMTVAQVEREQYGLERRGHDAGELTGPAGGERSRAADDYSTTGLFRDDNFGRDSCGDGDARTADRSWEGYEGRPPDIYRDAAESEFTVRNSAGLDDEPLLPGEEEEEEGEGGGAAEVSKISLPTSSPVRRRIVTR